MLETFSNYKTFLFDLDGTLIDSAASLISALNIVIKDILPTEVPVNTITRQLAGIGSRNLLRYAFEYHKTYYNNDLIETLVPHFLDAYESLYDQMKPFDGADKILRDLAAQDKNLILTTNKPRRFTPKIMDELGWTPLFKGIFCPDDVSAKKPNPAHLTEALEKTGISSDSALMVGDSSADYNAALDANIPVMIVTFSGQLKENFPKAVDFIDSYQS